MKIDLTNLPPDKQIAHVVEYIVRRASAGAGHKQTIFATDLAAKFKHRGAGYGADRTRYFSGLLSTANKVLAKAMGAPEPAGKPEPATPVITDGTP